MLWVTYILSMILFPVISPTIYLVWSANNAQELNTIVFYPTKPVNLLGRGMVTNNLSTNAETLH
jgi:hypothetical protein